MSICSTIILSVGNSFTTYGRSFIGSNLIYYFQAWIGSDKSFTYDYVFDTASQQEEVYEDTVKGLVDGTFEGEGE